MSNTPTTYLVAMRYGEIIRQGCESVEDAVQLAIGWSPDSGNDVSYAAVMHLEDAAGRIIVEEAQLHQMMADAGY